MKKKRIFLMIVMLCMAMHIPMTVQAAKSVEVIVSCEKNIVQGHVAEILFTCKNTDNGLTGISVDSLTLDPDIFDLYAIEIVHPKEGWQIYGTQAPFIVVDDSGQNPYSNTEILQFRLVCYVKNFSEEPTVISIQGSFTDCNFDDIVFEKAEVSLYIQKEATETETVCRHLHTVVRNQKDASCVFEGFSGDLYCEDCKKKIESGTVIPALGHQTVVKNEKVPTCEQDGYSGDIFCERCMQMIEKGVALPALSHRFEDGVCVRCGYKDTDYIKSEISIWPIGIGVAAVAILIVTVLFITIKKNKKKYNKKSEE